VRKVRVLLAEKGIEDELNPVTPFAQSDEFRAISPLGKIPVYEEEGFTLPDSSCIGLYLERSHPQPPLYPSDARDFGRALFYEEYADTRLVESIAPVFVQRVVTARIMKGESDESVVREALEERIPPVLDWLETQVVGGFLAGERFSIADVAVASPLLNLQHAGEGVDAARWPRLAPYLEGILARPSFAKLIAEERAGYAGL